jgi:putative pyruvate formate lyase activating enzyme
VALASLHQWEEPCISGERGSGTIFFAHCNLQCVFCQNFDISQQDFGKELTIEELAQLMRTQERRGAHNINLVSATQFLPQVRSAILIARESGLKIPIVYNSNGYESVEAIRSMAGVIDVYLPDLKYCDDAYARKYSSAPDYFEHATKAILEMFHQVGAPQFDPAGMIKQGMIIRHMLLPGHLEDSKRILDWVEENLPYEVYLSLMAQYTPMYHANQYEDLTRRISEEEYDELIDYFFEIGLDNGYIQELSSATSNYTPSFDLSGLDE